MRNSSSKASIAVLLAVFVLLMVFQAAAAQESPTACPPGQEKKNGCKWVQHQQTGECKWLPAQAVAVPWIEVQPDGYCPPVNGTQPPETTPPPDGTQPPYATAKPHPPREQPGGPGNLGVVIAGGLASLGMLATAGAVAWRSAARKRP